MNSLNISRFKKNELKTISFYTGSVCVIISLSMLIPIITAFLFNDSTRYINGFIFSLLITLSIGLILVIGFRNDRVNLSFKGALLFVSAIWFIASFFIALPFFFSGDLSFIDSFYQGMCCITTTGYSMYDIEVFPPCLSIWLCLTQWLGGLGIILLLTVVIPTSVSLKRLFAAEGRSEQITPNVRHTAQIFIKVYLILTSIGILLYFMAGLNIFDAICYTFAAIATGGYSVNPASVDYFNNPVIQFITMFLMIMGGINFVIHYKIMKGDWKNIHKDIELRSMFWIIIIATTIIASNLYINNFYNQDIFTIITHALFQVISIHTSTAFTSTDILQWPALSYHIMIVLMFLGSSINSTSGGIKLYNVSVLVKSIWWELQYLLLPKNTVIQRKIYHIRPKEITEHEIRRILVFAISYMAIFVISTIIILFYTNNFMYAYTYAAAALGNTGLYVPLVTTSSPILLKIVLIIDFWIGRIGVWPVLIFIVFLINFNKTKISQRNNQVNEKIVTSRNTKEVLTIKDD